MTSSLTQEGPCDLFPLCARVSAAAESLATETALLACLPPTPLPLECFDCVLALRRFSLPSVTPNAASLWREKEKEGRERKRIGKREQASSKGQTSVQGSGEARPKDSSILPFCRSQRKPTHPLSLLQDGVWGPCLQMLCSQEAPAGMAP